MDLNAQVEKASAIMARYRMSREDQIACIKILLDVGVERCLAEQERLREQKNAMIEHAQRNPLVVRGVN
jgi:2-keto-3-deoxy-L-rhamnonate aldolase RhmA